MDKLIPYADRDSHNWLNFHIIRIIRIPSPTFQVPTLIQTK